MPDPSVAPEPCIEDLVRRVVGAGHRFRTGAVWLSVTPEGAGFVEQGWKLHVSTGVAGFAALVERLVPELVAEGCPFKLARSTAALRELNDGQTYPASVGKAFTVYPRPDRVRGLGLRLAELLRGHEGPRVLSDRRVRPDAPVYYRYGPIAGGLLLPFDLHGKLTPELLGPGGARFDALATLTYRQPSWVTDPFDPVLHQGTDDPVLGRRFRVLGGIRESAGGNVYRAVDEETGTRVVVKQARPFVAEYSGHPGGDILLRLRNERRVLQVLAGVPGVPALVDHFRQGDDEYLATTDLGERSLLGRVRDGGPLPPAEVHALGRDLAGILDRVHERRVVMRDVTPSNVILGPDGPALADFGIAAHAGLHLIGGTAGYAPARQFRDEAPDPADDLHALGAVLAFAATGLEPVVLGGDHDLSATRARQVVQRACGAAEPGAAVDAAVDALLSGDGSLARDAARRLRVGEPPPASAGTPPLPEPSPERLAALLAVLRADLLAECDALPDRTDLWSQYAIGLHGGTTGAVLELLHHRDAPGVQDRIRALLAFTARMAEDVPPVPGLFAGTTGLALAWHEARAAGITVPDVGPAHLRPPGPDWSPTDPDLVEGAAGVGLAHLRLYRLTGDDAHLDVATRCVPAARTLPSATLPTPRTAVDGRVGRAHGWAGRVDLLLGVAEHTGATTDRAVAAYAVRDLADRVRPLVAQAAGADADPMAASWCQGLAGIGRTLLRAATVLADDRWTALAEHAARACLPLVRRMNDPGQCCGIAGVGELWLDLAGCTGDPDHRTGALDVATALLLRGGGPADHPVFVQPGEDTRSVSWANGTSGLVGFVRRLHLGGRTALAAVDDPAAPGLRSA